MDINPLQQFIDQSRAVNRSDAEIRTDLKNAGWSDDIISQAVSPQPTHKSGAKSRLLLSLALLLILLGGGGFAAYYFYTNPLIPKSVVNENKEPVTPAAPTLNTAITESSYFAQYGDCLKKQDWYTHEVVLKPPSILDRLIGWFFVAPKAQAQISIDFPTGFPEEMSFPERKENPCQEAATWNADGELLRFLSNSEDPIIMIELAFNPHAPQEVQSDIYAKRSQLPADWSAIDQTAGFNRSLTPQQWLVSNFAQNKSIKPEIMDDMVRQYSEKGESFMRKVEIAWMLNDPNDPDNGAYPYGKVTITPPSQALLSEIDVLAKQNDPAFNLEISRRKGLLNSTIEYLLTDIEYTVLPGTSFGPPFQGITSVNDEVHKNITQYQVATRDILLTQLKQLRECKYEYECDMAPENLKAIEKDLISKKTRDFFFEDKTPIPGATGETLGSHNYNYLLQNIASSPMYGGVITSTQMHNGIQTSSETLQLLLDTYANKEMLDGLAKGSSSTEYFSAFQKVYPDLNGTSALYFERALSTAYNELRRREKLAAWIPPAQRTLVWDLASWWELEDSRVDSIGKCDDGTTYHQGRKVYLMSLGVGYEYVTPNSKELQDKILQKVLDGGWKVCGQGQTEKTSGYQQNSYDSTYVKDGYLLTIRTFPDSNNLLNYAFEYDAK